MAIILTLLLLITASKGIDVKHIGIIVPITALFCLMICRGVAKPSTLLHDVYEWVKKKFSDDKEKEKPEKAAPSS